MEESFLSQPLFPGSILSLGSGLFSILNFYYLKFPCCLSLPSTYSASLGLEHRASSKAHLASFSNTKGDGHQKQVELCHGHWKRTEQDSDSLSRVQGNPLLKEGPCWPSLLFLPLESTVKRQRYIYSSPGPGSRLSTSR